MSTTGIPTLVGNSYATVAPHWYNRDKLLELVAIRSLTAPRLRRLEKNLKDFSNGRHHANKRRFRVRSLSSGPALEGPAPRQNHCGVNPQGAGYAAGVGGKPRRDGS